MRKYLKDLKEIAKAYGVKVEINADLYKTGYALIQNSTMEIDRGNKQDTVNLFFMN